MNSEILCPVCGCGFEEKHKIIACEECLTPHHHDCWDYSGKCAIYGCSSTINGENLIDSNKSVSRTRKFRGQVRRKPAVLTKSVSSVAVSSSQQFNDYLVLIYKKLSIIQKLAFRYVIYSMMAFPLVVIAVGSVYKSGKGFGCIAVIPMYPTFLAGYLFLFLVIPITIFRAYFKIVNYTSFGTISRLPLS